MSRSLSLHNRRRLPSGTAAAADRISKRGDARVCEFPLRSSCFVALSARPALIQTLRLYVTVRRAFNEAFTTNIDLSTDRCLQSAAAGVRFIKLRPSTGCSRCGSCGSCGSCSSCGSFRSSGSSGSSGEDGITVAGGFLADANAGAQCRRTWSSVVTSRTHQQQQQQMLHALQRQQST